MIVIDNPDYVSSAALLKAALGAYVSDCADMDHQSQPFCSFDFADAARERLGAYLGTQDFMAPGFCEKLGYNRFVALDNFFDRRQRKRFMKRRAA